MCFRTRYLHITQKSVSLYCVFHSIRFKVNKGWSKALLLFLCLYLRNLLNILNRLPFSHFLCIFDAKYES